MTAKTYEITGVPMNGTAFGNGHDGWWYANGGASQTASRELYRLQPELFDDGSGIPRVVIELIGSGARAIEDLDASPDGSTLYGVGEGHLFTIDRQTGAQTDLGPLGIAATGFAFAETGEAFASVGSDVYAVDLATATATYAFPAGGPGEDLAGIQPAPPTVPGLPGGLAGLLALVLGSIGAVAASRSPRRSAAS